MATRSNRDVSTNETVFDLFDFFEVDGYTRIEGIALSDLTLQVLQDGALQPWPLISGEGIPDGLITSGKVYFTEVPGAAGTYLARWRPNGTGFWRLGLFYAPVPQVVLHDFDVKASPPPSPPGMTASFMRPGG